MSGLDSPCSDLLPAQLYRKIAVSQQEMLSNTLLLVKFHFNDHFEPLYGRDPVVRFNYLWSVWNDLYKGGPGGLLERHILYGIKRTVQAAFREVMQTSSHKTSICR